MTRRMSLMMKSLGQVLANILQIQTTATVMMKLISLR